MKLKRLEYRDDGIFSELLSDDGKHIAYCVERSYNKKPKLYNGTFQCMKGPHRLKNMRASFETFEIMGVKGHTGILFHAGNWHTDSDGCVLLGQKMVDSPKGKMVTASRITFTKFMNDLKDVKEFTLVVEGKNS